MNEVTSKLNNASRKLEAEVDRLVEEAEKLLEQAKDNAPNETIRMLASHAREKVELAERISAVRDEIDAASINASYDPELVSE